jgi:hypothetical protein
MLWMAELKIELSRGYSQVQRNFSSTTGTVSEIYNVAAVQRLPTSQHNPQYSLQSINSMRILTQV